jgi:hypothetical protein
MWGNEIHDDVSAIRDYCATLLHEANGPLNEHGRFRAY